MHRFITKIRIFIIALSLIYCNILYGEETALSLQLPEISKENLLKHIKYLASKETDGRLMGSPGSQKAGKYIEGVFSEYGLVPADKYSGYSQPFEIKARHLSIDNHLSIGSKIFEQKWNFIPLYFSGEDDVSGVTCLANYGLEIDDYKECKGKIAVVLDDTADKGEKKGELIIKKIELAQESGVKGLIIVTKSVDAIYNNLTIFPEFIPPVYLKRWQSQHPSMSNTLLEIKTTSTVGRQKLPLINIPVVMAIIDGEESTEGLTANIKVKFKDRTIKGRNIIGLINGKSNEIVVIGAHYDHLGIDGEGNIFYGADDNSSGVAALLEIASAFSKAKDKLKRSVLFIAFDGEEWGLQGANAYVENPAFPHNKTIAMLNMDTIGRNKSDEIYILGSLRSPDLKSLNDRVNEKIGLKLLDTIEFAFDYGSDHYPFYEKGIPAIDYTSSYHEDFHKITDTVEKVNIDKVSKVAELIFGVTYKIVTTDIIFDKPKYVYVPFPKK
ncbi:MAG: M20/M25/M40 family metallo-hydrolase [Nitrospinae bacterium]|nr:M20/M25/M40 family metallo-hydrolase [Nitrospinota bacterium]